jgi:predicted MPP superfamily phosphohydrolase
MKQLAWVTDIHLNFVTRSRIERFCRAIRDGSPDAVLVGGDIGEAASVTNYLRCLESLLNRPLYFVLGNHDYYYGRISEVRASILKLCRASSLLHWLAAEPVIELTPATGLVGHDSWADGRYGNGTMSEMLLNDYLLIHDFVGLSRSRRFHLLGEMGDIAAAHFARVLPDAFARFQSVILLTHVPPFRESCWYEGRISDDEALPHFACKAVGEVLKREMTARPDRHLTVLCGHTHGAGMVDILPNLRVITGGAEYGKPQVQEPILAQ